MVVVSLAVALATLLGSGSVPSGVPTQSRTNVPPAVLIEPTMAAPAEPTSAPTASVAAVEAASDVDGDGFAAAPPPQLAQPPELAMAPATAPLASPPDGPLLPEYRIVSYYGHPHDPAMGIVGELAIDEVAALLEIEAANYAAADPSRPVVPAFELIATVAQRDPGVRRYLHPRHLAGDADDLHRLRRG